MYYCPLKDKKGVDLAISKIRFSHLIQLQHIDEGYKVEYKSKWDGPLREKHLARVITSFANTEGGWLFIGVNDDGSIAEIDKARTDYGQQIAQIIKGKVSPFPRFDTRYIANPANKNKGVLAVYVYDGLDTPYICNGTVYIRIGSSKEPITASNRSEIDNLVARRNKNFESIDKFCKNELFHKDYQLPYCVIYMYKQSSSMENELIATIDEAKGIADNYNFGSWMVTGNSILYFNAMNVAVNAYTNILEIFDNGSIKMYFPLDFLPKRVGESISVSMRGMKNEFDLDGFCALDGYLLHVGIHNMMKVALTYLLNRKVNMRDYILRFELQNIRNCYLFYFTDNKLWANAMCSEGFKYSKKDQSISHNFLLGNLNIKNIEEEIENYLQTCFFSVFGLLPMDYVKFFNSIDVKVKRIIGDRAYTNHDLYKLVYGI